MRIYLDTEFTSLNRFTYRLISLALVAPGGYEFYTELTDSWSEDECSDFTTSVVIPQLNLTDYGKTTTQARVELLEFLDMLRPATIISDAMAWDWPLLIWLAGPTGLPDGIEAGTLPTDIQGDADTLVEAPHHALLDARLLAETVERHNLENQSHLSLSDIYPVELRLYGHMLVGLAQRRAMAEMVPGKTTLREMRARTRALLKDPVVLQQLRAEWASLPSDFDPWIWAIERSKHR
ncbi:hypothetical protein [Pseudomonas sp. D(2018)]|uniref:hypothetical protein n=1 Tax=Pseudomonas sp. D(2018) TaxID=2502238 RepID=UPI0015B35830|nr:hypothetical protein [Pseudomonas sp. D(2018)]